MTNFIHTPHGSKIAYNQTFGEKTGIVFLSGFGSDMQGKKALFVEKWAKHNNHSYLRFDYSGHGESSGTINNTCCSDWYNDAKFIINTLTVGKQILIGSSMGGWIMLMLSKYIKKKNTCSCNNLEKQVSPQERAVRYHQIDSIWKMMADGW